MLSLLVVPMLLGVSMLAQRPVSRWLKLPGPVFPLLPFAPEVPLRQRLAVRGAGVLFTCLLILTAGYLQSRREETFTARVKVGAGYAAAEAGVETGDLVTAVDGVNISDFSALRESLIGGVPTRTLTLLRGAQTLQRTVTLRDGLLGVQPDGEVREPTRSEAVSTTLRRFFSLPWLVLRALVQQPQAVLATPQALPKPGTWMAGLSLTLTLSFWLMLAVELTALVIGVIVAPPPRAR